MPDLMTSFNFVLEVGGVEIATFRKCAGFESETETIEYKEATKGGKVIIRKVPGAMKWGDITMERRLSAAPELWKWRMEIEDGKVDAARRDGSIVIMNSEKKEVARWNFERGWPSKWSSSELDAGSNEIVVEKVTITHEGLRRSK